MSASDPKADSAALQTVAKDPAFLCTPAAKAHRRKSGWQTCDQAFAEDSIACGIMGSPAGYVAMFGLWLLFMFLFLGALLVV